MKPSKAELRSKYGLSLSSLYHTSEEVAILLNISQDRFQQLRDKEPEVYGPNGTRSRDVTKPIKSPLWSDDLVALIAAYREIDEYGNQLITREAARKARIGLSRQKRNHWLEIAELA